MYFFWSFLTFNLKGACDVVVVGLLVHFLKIKAEEGPGRVNK